MGLTSDFRLETLALSIIEKIDHIPLDFLGMFRYSANTLYGGTSEKEAGQIKIMNTDKKNLLGLTAAFSVIATSLISIGCGGSSFATAGTQNNGEWEWQNNTADGGKDIVPFKASYDPKTGVITDGDPNDSVTIEGFLNGAVNVTAAGNTWRNVNPLQHTSAGHGPNLSEWVGLFAKRDSKMPDVQFVIRRKG